jgi:hypothetical protein
MSKIKKHLFGSFLIVITLLGIWGSSPSKKTNTYNYTQQQPKYISLGSMSINPSTNAITSWSGRYQFNYVSTYDFDLKRSTSEAYTCNCLVIVEINSYGTGRLVTSLGGDEKNVLEITSSYKSSNGVITINAKNQYGSTVVTHFNTVNSYSTDKFWIDGQNSTASVFSL